MPQKQKTEILSKEEKAEYRGLVSDAFNAAHNFTGSEEAYDALMNRLIAMEEFVRDRNNRQPSDKLEANFAKQANYAGSQFNTVSGILGHASNRVYGMLSRLTELKDLLNALDVGGAHIDYSDNVYVLTDHNFPSGGKGGEIDTNLTEFRKQPRLAILVKELSTIGIYTDDLVIRVGKVFEDKIRKLPYIIVEIPRLAKQVGICDQYGEATFVSQNILHPHIWASYTKRELAALDGVEKISFGMKWPMKVCNLLAYGSSDMTPPQFKKIEKINVSEYERDRLLGRGTVSLISEEMILNHMILHFLENNGAWPIQKSGTVKTLPGENWSALNTAALKGGRGIKQKLSLATIAKRFVVNQAKLFFGKAGDLPTREAGQLEEYPEITWEMLDDSFLRKTGTGHSSIERIFIEYGLKESHDISLEDYTLDQILEFFRDSGYTKWPAQHSDRVTSDPGVRWHTISNQLKRAHQGTSKPATIPQVIRAFVIGQAEKYKDINDNYPDKDSGSIPDHPNITFAAIDEAYLAQRGLGKKSLERVLVEEGLIKGEELLSEDMIFDHCLKHLRKYKTWPSPINTEIETFHGDTWLRWDSLLTRGQRGLPGDNTLVQLIHKRIAKQAERHIEQTGVAPNRQSGSLPDYPDITFEMVGTAFMAIKPPRKTSLRTVLINEGVSNERPFSLDFVNDCIVAHLNKHGEWPTRAMEYINDVEDETWKNWDNKLRKGIGCPEELSIQICIDNLVIQQAKKYCSINRTRKISLQDRMPDYPSICFFDVDKAYRKRKGRYKTTLLAVISQQGYSLNDGIRPPHIKP
jgi:hypothetical protein